MNAKHRGSDEIVVGDTRPVQAVLIGFYGLVLLSLAIRTPRLGVPVLVLWIAVTVVAPAGRAISRSPTPKELPDCAYACRVLIEVPSSSGTRWSGRSRRGIRWRASTSGRLPFPCPAFVFA